MRAEILIDPLMRRSGRRMIAALIEAAPIDVLVSKEYTGSCDLLVTYGTGHPVRRPWWKHHRESVRHCIGWDLGYWHQERGTMRATIDEDHPQAWIRPEAPQRWDSQGIKLRSDSKPTGPALIVGMGHKSLDVFGLKPLQWEMAAAQKARAMGYQPIYRPKKPGYPALTKVQLARGTIERALKGSALVICRHSNVAVDACIAGVPVMCEDGAAHALYRHGSAPSKEQRLEFLRSLAHWQYTPEEAKQAWTFLLDRLCA